MSPLERTRVEKAAADCGFELPPEFADGRLVLRSTRFPESVAVQLLGDADFALSASEPILFAELREAAGAIRVQGWSSLYQILEKAAATARTMPNRVAQRFHQVTANLPRSTEAERLVVQRVGQNLFRDALLDYWQGRCCVTGLAVPELLRASHIRPWALCTTDEQRLDVFNGLLLSPNLDALFDDGWVTFMSTGEMAIAASLPQAAQGLLGVTVDSRLDDLTAQHEQYLEFHRQHVFRQAGARS